jgi:hypothetical protein
VRSMKWMMKILIRTKTVMKRVRRIAPNLRKKKKIHSVPRIMTKRMRILFLTFKVRRVSNHIVAMITMTQQTLAYSMMMHS